MERKRLKKGERSDIRKDLRDVHYPGSAGLIRYAKMSLEQRSQALKEETPHTYALARARYVRMSPRKVRRVIDLIRGKSLEEARAILKYSPHRAAEVVAKVLESAAANGINDDRKNMLEDRMYVKAAFVDEGPALKRVLPRARGSAHMIKKRTSHITIIVGERNG
ncbi:50S ribosomal protein L22 [Meiothermus luteus]|uniref:Large ribosomal subunit protein uL22 n=2 Tax=Meiothermus luteus TaxID=2026184 RepID=A0A399EL02_9DEIN|nr:50S ribosomal protein L22 [Meiothermus luteus]